MSDARPLVPSISDDGTYEGEPRPDAVIQHQRRTVVVLEVGGVHDDGQQQSGRLGEDVVLGPVDLLARVEPNRADLRAPIQLVEERLGHAHRIVLGDEVIQALRRECRLSPIVALDEALHPAFPDQASSLPDWSVFTRAGPASSFRVQAPGRERQVQRSEQSARAQRLASAHAMITATFIRSVA